MKLESTQKLNKYKIPLSEVKKLKPIFSKDNIDFLKNDGSTLEKNLPSNCSYYSDLHEDTEWKSNYSKCYKLRHYRRDLDSLS